MNSRKPQRSSNRPGWAQLEIVLALGFLGLTASPLAAQPAGPNVALLDEIAKNAGRVESVFTRFVQERHLSLFQEPLRSEGCLCFQKPGRIRWEVTQPYQSILVSDGRTVAQFERVGDQWKKLDLGAEAAVQNVVSQIGGIMGGGYASSQRDYSVTATNAADGPVLTLAPRNPAMRKMMQAIEIHLAPDFRATRRVVLHEANGDFTDIHFSEQVAEPALPTGTFDCSRPVALEQIREAVQRRKANSAEKAGTP